MSRPINTWLGVTTCLALLGTVCFQNTLVAQQTTQMADGLISLKASIPDEVRAGEEFKFQIDVTNTSDNVMLHEIILRQRKADGFSVESMSLQSSNKTDKQSERESKKEKKMSSEKSAKSNSNGNEADRNQRDRVTIASLAPGESRTIQVNAAADNEGELRTCLEIVDYKPSLCLTSQVVKPELKLTKTAPEKANRCDLITIRYTATNNGSGDVGEFKIVDDLGDGLATIEGNQELEFTVDRLEAGDTREFIARVYATKLGKFSSRATAEAQNSDLKSRSAKTTTMVQAADLAVDIEGLGRLYGDELAKFTAHVTNTGNAPANAVQVRLMWPEAANLVDICDPKVTRDQTRNNDGNQKKNAKQPTPAKKKNSASKKTAKSDSNSKSEKIDWAEQEIIIDELLPGETASFEYALRPAGLDRVRTKIEALYVCAVEPVEDKENARAKVSSMANAEVEIVRLPALQIVVVDDEDPVRNGEQVKYTVRVWNEGDAADSNVKLSAELPTGLEFVSAEGPTDHEVNGSTIEFNPIESMEPGESQDFRIVAKNKGSGNVSLKASLSSESLTQKVTSEEPTRLVNRQASN